MLVVQLICSPYQQVVQSGMYAHSQGSIPRDDGDFKEVRSVKNLNRKLVTYLLTFMITMSHMSMVSARSTFYEDADAPTAGEMLADTVLVRPSMFVASIVGVVTFVITLPFSALGGNMDEAGKTLVLDPLEYTFVRPLGEL
jgi:hypothetical protein